MPRLARLLLTSVALAVGLAVPAGAAQKGVVTDLTWGVTEETQTRTAQAMDDIDAQWVRMNVGWKWTEPSEGVYEPAMLAKVDRAVALSRAAGARVLMYADQAPQWASGSSDVRYPPQDPADLAAFYSFLVQRYADKVDAWEVWNEPNHPNYWQPDPRGDPEACLAYAAMLRAVAPVIRAGDPSAPVLFGGLAYADYPYLERCYELDPEIGAFFDVMNVHPYAMGGKAPETLQDSEPADGRQDVRTFLGYREVRRTMADRGERKPVWLTEFGWSTATDGHPLGNVTPEVQADYLTRAFKVLEQDAYVEVATWYNLRNTYTGNDGPGWLDQLGLMKTDFTPKPAYHAFKAYLPPAPPPGATIPSTPAPGPAPQQPPPPGQAATPLPGQTATSVRLRVRRLARTRKGQRVRVSGLVTGAWQGAVRLTVERRARGKWRRARRASAEVTLSGRFSRRLRLPGRGRWRVHASYLGTEALAPSSSKRLRFRTRARRR